MRIAFVSFLILLFVAAPAYLLPRLMRTDSGSALMEQAARDIVAQLPKLPEIRTVAVAPIEGDYHRRLEFGLVDELRRKGLYEIMGGDIFRGKRFTIERLIEEFRDHSLDDSRTPVRADTVLAGKIQRDEKNGGNHLFEVQALLVDSASGKVIWTGNWRNSDGLQEPERKLDKTLFVICLAFAAGILVIFARREDPGLAISAEQ